MAALLKVCEMLCVDSEIKSAEFTPNSAATVQIVFIITSTLIFRFQVDGKRGVRGGTLVYPWYYLILFQPVCE